MTKKEINAVRLKELASPYSKILAAIKASVKTQAGVLLAINDHCARLDALYPGISNSGKLLMLLLKRCKMDLIQYQQAESALHLYLVSVPDSLFKLEQLRSDIIAEKLRINRMYKRRRQRNK